MTLTTCDHDMLVQHVVTNTLITVDMLTRSQVKVPSEKTQQGQWTADYCPHWLFYLWLFTMSAHTD